MITNKSFFTTMKPSMPFQAQKFANFFYIHHIKTAFHLYDYVYVGSSGGFWKWFTNKRFHPTVKKFRPAVDIFVVIQAGRKAEWFITIITFKRLLSSINSFIVYGIFTFFTFIWPFTCMNTFMYLELIVSWIKGFKPLWIFLCLLKAWTCLNAFSHSNGFCSEWLRLCVVIGYLFIECL